MAEQQQEQGIEIDRLSEKVIKSPLLLRRVCDRVYELMKEDIRNQRERTRNSGGRMFF